MRLTHAIDQLGLGGAERMLVDLANHAARDGHEVSVCITRSVRDRVPDLDPGIEVLVLERRRRFDAIATARLAGWLRSRQPEVLHAHGRSTYAYLAAMKQLRLHRMPILLHDHYGAIETDRHVPRWFRVWGRRHVAQYVGVSETLGDWARTTGLLDGLIRVIPNGIDLSPYVGPSAERVSSKGPLAGVMVAGLRWVKGLDVLLDALAQYCSAQPLHVSVIGSEADRAYVAECRRRIGDVAPQVTVALLGARADVPALLSNVDFAIHPARSESGPLVLIEFMASGLPFISARTGNIAGKAERLGAGRYVPPSDPAALARALEYLASTNRNELRAEGARNRAVALESFSVSAAMSSWYDVYGAICGGKP